MPSDFKNAKANVAGKKVNLSTCSIYNLLKKLTDKNLSQLAEIGILELQKIGKEIIYINKALYELLKK